MSASPTAPPPSPATTRRPTARWRAPRPASTRFCGTGPTPPGPASRLPAARRPSPAGTPASASAGSGRYHLDRREPLGNQPRLTKEAVQVGFPPQFHDPPVAQPVALGPGHGQLPAGPFLGVRERERNRDPVPGGEQVVDPHHARGQPRAADRLLNHATADRRLPLPVRDL